MSTNFLDRLRAVGVSLFLIVALAGSAFAGPFEDAVAKFANDDFSDTWSINDSFQDNSEEETEVEVEVEIDDSFNDISF